MKYDNYMDIIRLGRPYSRRLRMDIPHRAKQFAPFAALRGFEDCVSAKEVCYERKRMISEEQEAELNFRLRMLTYGMIITAIYFRPKPGTPEGIEAIGQYHTITDRVRMVVPGEYVQIGNERIPFSMIYDLEGDGFEQVLEERLNRTLDEICIYAE